MRRERPVSEQDNPEQGGNAGDPEQRRTTRHAFGSNLTVVEEAVLNALTGTLDVGIPYPLPKSNKMPSEETTPSRPPVP